MNILPQTTLLYRNFGWGEFESIRLNRIFLIHDNYFFGKQFWIGETGLNWWRSTGFGKLFTICVAVPTECVTPGTMQYLFLEENAIIDGFPGGTITSEKLVEFNLVIKIRWFEY